MAALLYQNKLVVGENTQVTALREEFKTDSYRVRANKGINPIEKTITLTWIGLTRAQANGLNNQLEDAQGVETVDYTTVIGPGTSQKWSSVDWSSNIMDFNESVFTMTATLELEYGA